MIGAAAIGIVIFALGIFMLWVLVYAAGFVRPKVTTETGIEGAAGMERKTLLVAGLVILTGLVLTVYGFVDPSRKAAAKERQENTAIDRGIESYATLCFPCHGTDGKGAQVPNVDPPRITPQLNRAQFADSYKGDPDEFKKTYDLVEKTITRGRPGTPMPAWGQSDGGTLNVEQIVELATFITRGSKTADFKVHGMDENDIEGETPWDVAVKLNEDHYAHGVPSPLPIPTASVPPELQAGADLFSKNGCVACHATSGDTKIVGPSLAGVGQRAGTRKPGMSAEDYIKESVRQPSAYIVEGFPGPPSLMPPFSTAQISDADLDNLIKYLESLK
jgi:mono/diheme cytochrome c family protein